MSDSTHANTYLSGNNAVFLEEMYAKYLDDHSSVDEAWQQYFKSLGDDNEEAKRSLLGAVWNPYGKRIVGVVSKDEQPVKNKQAANAEVDKSIISLSLKVSNLIDAYRTYGHMGVNLDPLGINKPKYHAELDYRAHGISDEDLKKEAFLPEGFGAEKAVVENFIHYLSRTYSGRIAAEYMHIESTEERVWLQHIIESSAGVVALSTEEKLEVFQHLLQAKMFEHYLHTKFPGTKRFSIEGLENVVPSIKMAIKESVSTGVRECVIGMAHRGRLNTLTNVMGKPFHAMFAEFKGGFAFPDDTGIPGDVKYHLGISIDTEIDGHKVHMSLTPNPSHLEVVNSVVLGKVRAKQDLSKDDARNSVLGVLLHGDAAFAGQGSVMEALSLSQLNVFHTGGTIHIVTNNQIGFTTNPKDSRSTNYSTDIAKFIGAPILHVNGDDAEAVAYVSKLAAQYRAKFKKDVVIDIVGYREYGHNEGDEPFFTQPIMYKAIKDKNSPDVIYEQKLLADALITQAEVDARRAAFKAVLDTEFEKSIDYKPQKADWLEGEWSKMKRADAEREEEATGCKLAKLKEVGLKLAEYPTDFNINPKVAKQLEAKAQMVSAGKGFDWAMGEALAYGTLLDEGFKVRMTGQDVKRGTFSHRHAVLFDQNTEQEYTLLNNLSKDQKAFIEIGNSNLSEFAVLGFEYGYSMTHSNALTIWEGQFGDFANGAQVVIDQYIASGEAKWLRMSGIVLLLPHGYEGQGPEHSSARLERFLQLCASDNMQVVNCTTPASFFHVIRRQMHRNFRKPLIVMSPKSLLRHKLVVSDIAEFADGTKFLPVLPETDKLDASKVKRVLLSTGKVYYDLYEKRAELKRQDIALVRLEQVYPFPAKALAIELKKYPNAEVVWCQEEHENMGAYQFVEPFIEKLLIEISHKSKRAKYIGRAASASPAVGYMKLHIAEQQKMIDQVFNY